MSLVKKSFSFLVMWGLVFSMILAVVQAFYEPPEPPPVQTVVYVCPEELKARAPNPKYDPNRDLTGSISGLADGKINMKDVAVVAKEFGKTG